MPVDEQPKKAMVVDGVQLLHADIAILLWLARVQPFLSGPSYRFKICDVPGTKPPADTDPRLAGYLGFEQRMKEQGLLNTEAFHVCHRRDVSKERIETFLVMSEDEYKALRAAYPITGKQLRHQQERMERTLVSIHKNSEILNR